MIYTAAGDSEGTLGGLVRQGEPPPSFDDLGDRLLALVAEARAAGVDPGHALRDAVRRVARPDSSR